MFEKVNPCHPDKVADRIAGALVDAAYRKEENPRGLSTIWITQRNAPTPMLAILYLMKAARWFIPESSRALEVQPVPSWYR